MSSTSRQPRHLRPLCPEDYYVEGWSSDKSEFVYNFGWVKKDPQYHDHFRVQQVIRAAELELRDAEKHLESAKFRHQRHHVEAANNVASARKRLMELLLMLATTPGYDPEGRYERHYNRLDAINQAETTASTA
jgi:hypothetical protein